MTAVKVLRYELRDLAAEPLARWVTRCCSCCSPMRCSGSAAAARARC